MAEPRVPMLLVVPAAILTIVALVYLGPRILPSERRKARQERRWEREKQEIADRCDAGDGAACAELADWTSTKDAFGRPDYAASDALRKRACELGHPPSCPKSKRKAKPTCECSDGAKCAEMATQDKTRVRACADAACAKGPGEACATASVAVQEALGREAAYPYLQKACALGSDWGCYREYVDQWNGDVDAWFYMLTGMCEKGTVAACLNLAVEYGQGGKGRKDPALATRFKKRACKLDPQLCDSLPKLPAN